VKRMIVLNVEKCLGCKSCEIACAVAHSVAKDLYLAICETPSPRARVSVEVGAGVPVPIQCRHCEDAPCIAICPTGAIHRENEDSPVIIDHDRCIGCKMCIQVCPFGVIGLGGDGKGVVKCDLCAERLGKGEEPACICACPTGALWFGDVEQASRTKRRQAARELLSAQEKAGAG